MVSRHEQQKIIIEATNNFMTEIFNVYKNFKYMIYLFNYFIEGFRKSIFMASIGKIEMWTAQNGKSWYRGSLELNYIKNFYEIEK